MSEGALPCPSVSSHSQCYDVCIIHCAADVHGILSKPIAEKLISHGFQVFFLPEEKLQSTLGSVENAIRTSAAHIAIFSVNFAGIPANLEALCYIRKWSPHSLFVPVFYDVEPWHLRYVHKGIYAPAFIGYKQDPERQLSDKIITDWEQILHQISLHYGMELNSQKFNGDITKLVDVMASKLLMHFKKEPLGVSEYQIGVEDLLKDYEKVAECHDSIPDNVNNVRIVGIVGMRGSGKTELAKTVYNRMLPSFVRSSFLFNVRESTSRFGIVKLQRKCLKDILKLKLKISSALEGKALLRDKFAGLRVLIVLDDVSDETQLESLLVRDVLDHSSYIIVTTCDRGILQRAGITLIHDMKLLQENHAKQLFCRAAFGKCFPLAGYEIYVQQFLKLCDGLPLSLKLIGEHLFGKYVQDYWKYEVERLSRELLPGIKNAITFVYDTLDAEAKNLLISLAQSVDNQECQTHTKFLEEATFAPILQLLDDKCFIKIEKGYQIKLHNQIKVFVKEVLLSSPGTQKVSSTPTEKQESTFSKSQSRRKRTGKRQKYK